MISRFSIKNFKALRDVTLDLTPMHVLIGPNDTGKTSILQALYAYCRSAFESNLSNAFAGKWGGRQLVWRETADAKVSLGAELSWESKRLTYAFSSRFPDSGRELAVSDEVLGMDAETPTLLPQNHSVTRMSFVDGPHEGQVPAERVTAARAVRAALRGVHFHRWIPRMLALPVAPDSSRRFRMDTTGFGLASCLDDILGYDRDKFTALENRFRGFFPQVESVKLIAEPAYRAVPDAMNVVPVLQTAEGKGVYFQFVGEAKPLPASLASDGLVLVLAYLAIMHLPEPPRVVLVEEPENGVHPKRLAEVLQILRQLVEGSGQTQILMTTHSPYVLDCFKPEEVTLCRRTDQGDIAVKRLSESKRIKEQLDMFTLGEIWTSEGDEAIAKE